MKLTVTITGDDAARLAERVNQLVRTRSNTTPVPDDDFAAPPAQSAQRPPRDRRS